MGHRSCVRQPRTLPRAHRRCRGRCLDKSGSSFSIVSPSSTLPSSRRRSSVVRSSTTTITTTTTKKKSHIGSASPPSRVGFTGDAELDHVPSWRRYRNADRWGNGGSFAFRWRQRRLGYRQVDPEIVQDLSWIIRVVISLLTFSFFFF